jgi:serine/threonine-protein kinase
MVGKYGQVYLMDWGVASVIKKANVSAVAREILEHKKRKKYKTKEEKSGSVVGTPCYMAPEQAYGDLEAIDERSDVFSLGAIIYEILTGSPPILGDSLVQMVRSARKCEIQFPDERVDFPLPIGLVKVTMKAMNKDPSDRYQSVRELKNALEGFLTGGWYLPGRDYKSGQLIVSEGEMGMEAFIIRKGKCRAFKTIKGKTAEIRVMRVGDVFGETSLFTGKPRSLSVEAVEDVSLSVVTKHHLEKGLGLGAWLGVFLHSLAGRFREVDQRARHYEELLNGHKNSEK